MDLRRNRVEIDRNVRLVLAHLTRAAVVTRSVENKYRLLINVTGALAVKHGWLGIQEKFHWSLAQIFSSIRGEHASDRAPVAYTSRLYAYTRVERRDRFIPLRSTCTVKMQSRLARQRIHQHTRAHTRQPCRPRCAVATELGRGGGRLPPPSLPLFTSLSTCSDIIDKSQFSRLCRNSTFRFSSSFIIYPCL